VSGLVWLDPEQANTDESFVDVHGDHDKVPAIVATTGYGRRWAGFADLGQKRLDLAAANK
jgi:hypothetical protein